MRVLRWRIQRWTPTLEGRQHHLFLSALRGAARSVLSSYQAPGVRFVPEFRLLLMGLSEIICPRRQSKMRDCLLFLCTKPCSAMPVITYCGRRSVADKWKPHWTTINTVLHFNGHFQTLNHAVYRVTKYPPWCLSLHPSWIRKWFSDLLR